ncbi:MAG: YwmB family TATA-box binding protein [Veillonellaceae bacterium]|nr:YwmB family TATA-box binding protein [Veillonellaceae bacterium]
MKYNIRVVLGVICVLSVFIIIIGHAENQTRREPLSAAMKAAGAGVEEMSVNAWSNVPAAGQADADLENMARSAIEKLGISPDNYQLSRNHTEYQRMVRAEAIADYFHAVVISEVILPQGESKQPETYLVVMVETKPESETDLAKWNNKITAVIKDFGGTPRISTCLVGWLDGKLIDGEDNIRIKNGFNAVNATIIDETSYDNFASYTGFTPAISDYLEVSGKRININMAMRYSPYDNRTYITIGSPVITREY